MPSPEAVKLMITCHWHEGEHPISDASQNGRIWKCRKCYSSERGLQANYQATYRSHIWASMSVEERRAEILKNNNSEGKGKKRIHDEDKESTSVRDKLSANADKPFMRADSLRIAGSCYRFSC